MASTPSAPSASPARLLRVASGEKFLLSTLFRIGRDPDCPLRVLDPHVSRIHAEIRREGDRYVLYDLSTNGTFVNAGRVEGSHPLTHGDMIRVASESFVFMTLPGEPEGVSPVADVPAAAVAPVAPPRRPEPTGGTDPGERTAFIRRASRKRVPVWVYIGAAVAVAILVFLGLLLLVAP